MNSSDYGIFQILSRTILNLRRSGAHTPRLFLSEQKYAVALPCDRERVIDGSREETDTFTHMPK